jgi:pimeloyl-ACP methyl ester carboxylesterase
LELDIVCHSRGGLVARAFVELLRHQHRVRRVVFVGVPQAGTRLANPALWGTMADVLVNLVAEDPTGLLGRLSGLLFYLAAQDVTQQVPGLQAMNPLTWDDPSGRSLLARLRDSIADSSKYFVVASNYTPERDSLSIFSLLQELGNGILDRFFDCPNDLVVDTPSMWSIGGNLGYSQQVPEAFEGRVLLLNAQGDGPKNVEPRTQAGVHHVNYFQQPAVRDFIRQSLDRDD